MLILTDQNFSEEVLRSFLPVLVDFWAEWCMPCHMMTPILQEITKKFTDKIKVGKFDVDKNPQTAAIFSITAIPTLILFKNGKAVRRFMGIQPTQVIEEAIKSVAE